MCLSAQSNPQGVPKELLEAKKLELIQEKVQAVVRLRSRLGKLTFSRSMPRKPPKKHESGRNRKEYGIGTLMVFANVNGVTAGEVAEEVVGEAVISTDVRLETRGLLQQDVVIHPTGAIIEVLHQGGR